MDHFPLGTTYKRQPLFRRLDEEWPAYFFPFSSFSSSSVILFFSSNSFSSSMIPLIAREIQGEREMGERGKETERDGRKRKRQRDGERFV